MTKHLVSELYTSFTIQAIERQVVGGTRQIARCRSYKQVERGGSSALV